MLGNLSFIHLSIKFYAYFYIHLHRSSLGYCPQFSYLPEFLNVQECLELFADLRGLDRYNTSQILIDLITLFKLERFKNRKIQDLRFDYKLIKTKPYRK
jgi:ABC-type multidrug transport system ATPase subunit